MELEVSPFYVAVMTLFYLFLNYRVISMRRKFKVGLGSAGNEDLQRAIRVQGNFAEHVPLILLLMVLMEYQGLTFPFMHGLGVLLIVSRSLHMIGLSGSPGVSFGRFWGTFLSFSLMILLSLGLVVNFIQKVVNEI